MIRSIEYVKGKDKYKNIIVGGTNGELRGGLYYRTTNVASNEEALSDSDLKGLPIEEVWVVDDLSGEMKRKTLILENDHAYSISEVAV